MLSRITGAKDFAAGMIYVAAGAAIFVAAQRYDIGTAMQMGPGYFPALLGLVLAGLGLGSIIQGIRAKTPDPILKHNLEPLFLIVASIVSFGLLIDRAGLVVATFVCLFLACFRRALSHPFEVLATFAVLTAFNYVTFIYFFGMTIPVFWWDY